MAVARKWISSLLLGLPEPLRSLRTLPVLGNLAHRLSRRFLPVNEKVWARVERDPGEGLWLELNPRTGQHYMHGDVEPAVQKILAERLKPGMVFYDLGANIGFFSLLAARHPLILCEMHSDANDKFLRELFGRFGYNLESVDDLHVLAVPQLVAT